MSRMVKVILPVMVTVIVGWLITLNYVIDNPTIAILSKEVTDWGGIVAAASVFVGLISLVRRNVTTVMKDNTNERLYSIWLLLILVITLVTGLISTDQPIYVYIYNNITFHVRATLYALMGFSVVYATYKARLSKDVYSLLFAIGVMAVIFKNTPIMTLIYSGFEPFGEWVLAVPMTASLTALTIGVGISGAFMGIRILLGRERGYIRGKEGE